MSQRTGGPKKILGLSGWQVAVLIILGVLLCLAVAAVLLYALGVFDDAQPAGIAGDPPTPTPAAVVEIPSATTIIQEASPVPTETPSAPASGTPSPTSTVFTTTPSTASPTPSQTATPLVDVCETLDLRFISATSNIAAWRLLNDSGADMILARIEIDWPRSNDAIFNVFQNGKVIWSDEDLAPPTTMTTWIGAPADRSAGRLSRVEFFFGTMAAASGYDVRLSFENGCEVSSVN